MSSAVLRQRTAEEGPAFGKVTTTRGRAEQLAAADEGGLLPSMTSAALGDAAEAQDRQGAGNRPACTRHADWRSRRDVRRVEGFEDEDRVQCMGDMLASITVQVSLGDVDWAQVRQTLWTGDPRTRHHARRTPEPRGDTPRTSSTSATARPRHHMIFDRLSSPPSPSSSPLAPTTSVRDDPSQKKQKVTIHRPFLAVSVVF